VLDFGEPDGYGICFNDATVGDITYSIYRAVELYKKPKRINQMVEQIMQIDHSWENSAGMYLEVYKR
jgi:starch synthase